jgi:SAM-dependent methyltransferase
MVNNEQIRIKEWFDNTYKSRGNLYLRPWQAYVIFAELLLIKKGEKLLDVACGLGRMLEVGKRYGAKLSGIDISEIAVKETRALFPYADILEGNAEELPFDSLQFDHITCIGSLERMLDRRKVISEMKRVLKQDGKICLMLRNSESIWWIITKKWLGTINKEGHQDALNLKEWTEFLESCGLRVEGCYPDQWPYKKFLRVITLGLFFDYKKIIKSFIPIQNAYEFIFICKKA